MIEIEVEMDTEVSKAEMSSLQDQIAALKEVEALQEQMTAQAEALDEVDRLLKQSNL